jgi:transposase
MFILVINVAIMYIDASTAQGKYTRYLLRESYREEGKVKHRTIANLSRCSHEEIEALRLALKHKDDLSALGSLSEDVSVRQGLSVGAAWLVYAMTKQLGITEALGPSREGKLALWQVMARVIDQGSRLSAVRLASSHAACDVLGLERFNEDDLYQDLDWVCKNQALIEDRLFKRVHAGKQPRLYLYDVTSSYLEGQDNDLGEFGYNRDGKKGKRQIVMGLLCDEEGRPVSIEVFPGNTPDANTIGSQIRKVAQRFGGGEITFVGDRGMIKSTQVEDLMGHGFHYITAITKPQVEALLAKGTIQMSLFDQELAEIVEEEGTRYILRRNPLRAKEIEESRQSKYISLERAVKRQNEYLAGHPRAKEEVALRKVRQRCEGLKVSKWITVSIAQREIKLEIDERAREEERKLDGCYVLKTDLKKAQVSKETIHARYKDLSLVEWAFRTSKTVELEMRPVYVRRERRTRGHAVVVMLAYCIVQELAKRWRDIDLTVEEGIQELTTLCATEMLVKGNPCCNKVPIPRPSVQRLLDKAKVRLPAALPCRGIHVATRKKLPDNRKRL